MKRTIFGATLISFAAILWGLDGVVLTPRLYNLDVAFVVFLLHLIPFAIMNIFMFKEYKYLKKFTKDDIVTFLLIAVFGGALGTLAIVRALFLVNFDHLSVVVLLQKLQPIFAILLAGMLLREKMKKSFILWASIAITASYFLAFGFHSPNYDGNLDTLKAVIWSVIAALSFGSATVFGKKVLKKYSFKTSTFYRFGLTSAIMFLYVLFTSKLGNFSSVTSANWAIFLIIAFTTGSGAIFIYYYGLKRVKAIVSTICELFFPISAVIFDYLINKSMLTPVQWISALVMVLAIIRVSKN